MTADMAFQILSDDCESLLFEAYLLVERGEVDPAEVDVYGLISQLDVCAERCANIDPPLDFLALRTKLLFYHEELARLIQ